MNEHAKFMAHRPTSFLVKATGVVTLQPAPIHDDYIIDRIIAAYGRANATSLGGGHSMWLDTIADLKLPIHDAFVSGQRGAIESILRDPRRSTLFYGYDQLCSDQGELNNPEVVAFYSRWTYDCLIRLAEAVGVVGLYYPETQLEHHPMPLDPDELLALLDDRLGFKIDFPNPYVDEFGLQTSRGVASYRSIQSIYQAWLAVTLCDGGSIIEIGGGLGRTAYYAKKLGIEDYTIIDLPMTGLAQAYFLERIGVKTVLYGETLSDGASVKILPPTSFFEQDRRYDLALNVDSFTEMSVETASSYLEKLALSCRALLSINHEVNAFRVHDLLARQIGNKRPVRDPYWLRNGYVKEFIRFD